MIFLKDSIRRSRQCKYLVKTPSFQPKTNEIFYEIIAIGYDGIRRVTLFVFNTEEEMNKKYEELFEEYMYQQRKELNERST